MNICVYGASSNKIADVYIKTVEKLGEEIAKRGHTLIFGAGSSGCMGASARGADRGHGKIVGIVPSFFNVDGVIYENCTELIKTETMRERKKLLEEYSDAFIMVPGGIGTFDEFFEIITLKQLERHSKVIAILNINGYYDDLERLLRKAVDENFMQEGCMKLISFFEDIDEMLDYVEKYVPEEIGVSELKHIEEK